MNRKLVAFAGALVFVSLVGLSARSRRASQEAERVPYEVVGTVGDAELRRYPTTLAVETVAPSTREAFGRLFRYIAGANKAGAEIAMTAPVATGGEEISMTAPVETSGAKISMTAPVETDDADGGVRMAFFLPAEYDYDTAPQPTDSTVQLVERPARTLAVLSFSWWATDGRTARKQQDLLDTLADADVAVDGEPFLMQYDAPWTPPFLRTNEVAVEVRRRKSA